MGQDMELAPIVLFVYNRPWHTKQTLEALSKNTLADESILYIYADGPKKDILAEDLAKIQETRQVVKEKQWCKEVHIIESSINKGLADSVIQGVSEVVNRYKKIIVLEDDIFTSPVFLQYLNDSLNMYADEENIYGISGYTYPVKVELPDTYFLHMGCSWGWATWKRAWQNFESNSELLLKKVNQTGNISKFNVGGYPFFDMLQMQSEGKINSWAIRFYATLFLHKAYFLFPKNSLCTNIGFDNSGTHCEEDAFFKEVKASQQYIKLKKMKVKEDRYARKAIEESFASQFLDKKNMGKKKSIVSKVKSAIKFIIN